MSKEFELSDDDSKSFSDALEYAKKWCSENQLAVGVGEMAVGAGLIAWGVHNGVIEMGTQLVGTELSGVFTKYGGVVLPENFEPILGAAAGASIGAIAGSILGSIGIAAMGTAIGIPAALVIGGAAAVLGMAGYIGGEVVHDMTHQAVDIGSLTANGSLLIVGVALLIDGARRCITDEKVKSTLSVFKDKVIKLNDISVQVIAKSMKDLEGLIQELKKVPVETYSGAVIGASIGATTGTAVVGGSVFVLGSNALGGVAISLGIVSAPVWPIIAGAAGGAGLGYAAYKAIKYWGGKPESENS